MVPLSFQLGVSASLLGSVCGTLGGQLRIKALTCTRTKAALMQAFGWTFWLSGQGLNQVAILLAPATVAACVTFSGSLLSNALLAPLVLRERLTRLHKIGIVLLSVGGTAVTWSSSASDPFYTWPQMQALPARPVTVGVLAGAICLALAVLARAARRQHIDVVSFAYLFALTGATDLLVTKITLQLIRLQVMHVKRWERAPGGTTSALTALMLTLHVTIFFFQVMSVNYTKALQSVPLFMGSGAIMQISLCGVFFQEFNFTTVQAVVFFLGFGFVLTGLVVTSQASSQGHEQADKKPDKGAAGPAIVPIDGPPSKPEALAVADSPAMFVPPTAPGATDRPVISGGLLARSDSLFNSADFLLASELQRSAMVFGGNKPADEHFARKFPSFQSSLTPRLASGQMASPLLEEGSGEGRPTSWQKDPRKWRSCVSDGGRTGGRT